MENTIMDQKDEIVIKLLHYFIVEKGYNPIVLHGAQNEIWLENLSGDYKIVRIVSNYIHNDDQMDYDIFKTKQIMKKIKKKTMSLNMNSLNLYVNLGENVDMKKFDEIDNILTADIKDVEDVNKYNFIIEEFPDLPNKLTFTEKGFELFQKLTSEINSKGEKDAIEAEKVFAKKRPIITPILIGINILAFILSILIAKWDLNAQNLFLLGGNYGPAVKAGEVWRIITSAFLHGSVLHIVLNMYALNIIGPQIEGFFGKMKYLFIYLVSAATGSLLSILFSDAVSVGASGAIFGLLGALVYFGFHYRVYLDNVLRSQIIPLIIMNLGIGFIFSNIDNAAHIGGLIGGVLAAKAVGVKDKSTINDKVNGYIMLAIFAGFLVYMNFFN